MAAAAIFENRKITKKSRVCVCVCVCLPVRGRVPTLLHGPQCNLGEW